MVVQGPGNDFVPNLIFKLVEPIQPNGPPRARAAS